MHIEFKESFAKDLGKIDSAIRNKVKRVIEQIESVNSLTAIAQVKKIKGSAQNYHRIRIAITEWELGLKMIPLFLFDACIEKKCIVIFLNK